MLGASCGQNVQDAVERPAGVTLGSADGAASLAEKCF